MPSLNRVCQVREAQEVDHGSFDSERAIRVWKAMREDLDLGFGPCGSDLSDSLCDLAFLVSVEVREYAATRRKAIPGNVNSEITKRTQICTSGASWARLDRPIGARFWIRCPGDRGTAS